MNVVLLGVEIKLCLENKIYVCYNPIKLNTDMRRCGLKSCELSR